MSKSSIKQTCAHPYVQSHIQIHTYIPTYIHYARAWHAHTYVYIYIYVCVNIYTCIGLTDNTVFMVGRPLQIELSTLMPGI